MEIPGIAHRSVLARRGQDRRQLEAWKLSGAIRSVQPWYVTPAAPVDLVTLLKQGVRPTCLDGAALHGLFIPVHPGTHVFRPRDRDVERRLADVRLQPLRRRNGLPLTVGEQQPLVLHGPETRAWPDQDPVPELSLILEHAGRCLPVEKAAVLFESAVHLGRLTLRDAQRVVAGLPRDARRSLTRIRDDAESGTETVVRWWFESLGVRVRPQVPFRDGRQRADLMVGESWVIECDSRAHHDDPRSYDEDRDRDLYLRTRGYVVTRLTWEQVFLRWEETSDSLLQILRRGEHRKPARPGMAA